MDRGLFQFFGIVVGVWIIEMVVISLYEHFKRKGGRKK